MNLLKTGCVISVLAMSMAMVGCGGSSDSSSNSNNNGNNSGNQNNGNGNNGNGSNNNGGNNNGGNNNGGSGTAQQDILADAESTSFYLGSYTAGIGVSDPQEFAILHGENNKIAYQTKGFNWSHYSGSDELNLVLLTKNKSFTGDNIEQLISHKAGEYVVGSGASNDYRVAFKYKLGNLAGEKVLSSQFLSNTGLNEELLYLPTDTVQKFKAFIQQAQQLNDTYPTSSSCGVITHIEYQQPVVEFIQEDYAEAGVTLAEWVTTEKAQGETIKVDNFAGYQVAYKTNANNQYDSEAIVEYKGKTYTASYTATSTIDVKEQLEKNLKSYEDQQKIAPASQAQALQQVIDLQKAQLKAFNESKLCAMYNKQASNQILASLKKIPQL